MAEQRPTFRVSHVILDVDGTLVDFEAALVAALEASAAHASELCGGVVTAADLRQFRELVYAEEWGARTLREIRDESFRRVLVEGGVTTPEAVVEVSATYYRVRDEALRPYDDVEPVLRDLCERGFTLVAASNGNAALDAQAFFPYLTAVHHAEVAGVAKPDTRFFLGALEAVGGAPATAVSVGDRLENDIHPAHALGMPAILVDRRRRALEADVARIDSLHDLPGMLELAD
ncbi:MAG: HAD-IA family hydrolase [Dehalococcoidia bacterium]|nr:HAD-IA family hydrolase [Dehalococcoidia bacterium]